jgi:hypothetical protein
MASMVFPTPGGPISRTLVANPAELRQMHDLRRRDLRGWEDGARRLA